MQDATSGAEIINRRAFHRFDLLPDPIWIFDRQTLKILVINSAACAWLDYPRATLSSMTIEDLRPAEERPALRRTLANFTAEDGDAGWWRLNTRDGRALEAWIHWRRVAFEGRDAVLATARDVTELARARQNLSQAEQLLRLAGEKVRLGGWRVELDPVRVIWTPETAAIHGKPASYEPTPEEALAFYAPEDRPRIYRAFERCAATGEPFDEVCALITADGRHIWVRAIGSALPGADGKVAAIQGAFQDISELRAAEERAAAADRARMQTLESVSDAVFTLDRNWCFSFLNRRAQDLLERDRHDLIGRNIWQEFPEAAGTAFQAEYTRATETGQTARFEAYFPPLDKWFEVGAHPFAKGLAVYFRDVTEERARTEQLRLLETAVARQNDIVLITEAAPIDGPCGPRVVYVNDAFERLTGYAREEVTGRTPRILQGPRTSRTELDRIRAALAARRPVRAELVNYRKDGTAFWLEIDIAPIADASGRITHFVAVQRDITERKGAEERIRLSEERFRLLARATNEVIWDWDLETGKVWWNDNLQTVFGLAPEALKDGPGSWLERIHPDDRAAASACIRRAMDAGEENWTREYRAMRADGSFATVTDRGFVLRDGSGVPLRIIGSMIDVTDQRDLENRLRESQKLEAIGQLTGGVAHDFNNLLTVIVGNAEELTDKLARDPQLRLMAEMTLKAAERGAELTSRLLAFARKQTLQPRPLNLNAMIASMDGLLRRTLPEAIEIEVAGAPDLWPVEADPSQLEVAILNLAINARDAMPEGGTLRIETANAVLDDHAAAGQDGAAPGRYATITITDTGAGMDRDTLARAFEPFFTTKEPGKGSGLGLSMVFGFVTQSGGHVRLASEPGAGTRVVIRLPCSPRSVPDTGDGSRTPLPEGGSEHILVVEDNDLVRGHLAAQLAAHGYRVSSRQKGSDALAFLEANDDVDLLFTDIVMPGGVSGLELAEEGRRLHPGLKVLLTTGYADPRLARHAGTQPQFEILPKPYRKDELLARIRRTLRQ
ncbi:PAS domain-containing hybrid sensor histidine kinase/response regulator [Futiania mangrovi]|uniref:histidine kinase n=1 Tax=Futiania mangrovi TaxID=2959716 RepID=A0A9J6PHI8_9PROT|nr:PAS domain S-box protein [Futiania mangrovii]MCP1335554.1 PAS domain S-box protein [Futiania mangrovii]